MTWSTPPFHVNVYLYYSPNPIASFDFAWAGRYWGKQDDSVGTFIYKRVTR